MEGFQEIIARITTCYFWTKEPFGIPKEEEEEANDENVLVHRHQYGGGFKTPLTELGVGSAAAAVTSGVIRSGVTPKAKDCELDPDHFFIPSHSPAPHEHHEHHEHHSGTSSPLFREAEPTMGPDEGEAIEEEDHQGKQFTLTYPVYELLVVTNFFFFFNYRYRSRKDGSVR